MSREVIQKEVDANYDAFIKMLPSLLAMHRGQFALLKSQRVVGIYSSAADARTAAEAFIEDKIYSIQKITDVAIDLGYFSHAVPRHAVQSRDRASGPAGNSTPL